VIPEGKGIRFSVFDIDRGSSAYVTQTTHSFSYVYYAVKVSFLVLTLSTLFISSSLTVVLKRTRSITG
jgi:hypothetical protein